MRSFIEDIFSKNFSALPIFILGICFGVFQSALFFVIQVFVSATFVGYFIIVITWIGGVIYFMKYHSSLNLMKSLILSITGYYSLVIITGFFNISIYYFFLLFPFVFLSASSAGVFFREYSKNISSNKLFLSENNGFIFGLLISIILFINHGINFLYYVPLLIFVLSIISSLKYDQIVLVLLVLPIMWSIQIENYLLIIVFGLILLISIFESYQKINVTETKIEILKNRLNLTRTHQQIILLISGFNLLLLQYFLVRDFSVIISANELSILIVSISYFMGYSIGYYISLRIPFNVLKIISVVMFFLHLGIIVFAKTLASISISLGFSYETLIVLFFILSFTTSSYYSLFLPILIENGIEVNFVKAYSWELFGAVLAVVLLILSISLSSSLLIGIYPLLMLVLVFSLLEKTRWKYSFLLVGLFVVSVFIINMDDFYKAVSEDFYRAQGFDNPNLVYSTNSFYHSVDVLDTYSDGEESTPQRRISFINGVKYFQYKFDEEGTFNSPTALSEFTYYLAELPAKYQAAQLNRKLRILILGGGSLYSLNRVSKYSSKTTLVEIDSKVVEAAKQCWSELNKYDEVKNYEIIVDDAKHYLKSSDEKFDLIIMDISAPYYLGTALLHNEDFFKLVKSKLKQDGIFSESTQSRPIPKYLKSTSMKILKAVSNVFPKYRVIDSKNSIAGKRGFIFASEGFLFSTNSIADIMREDKALAGTAIYWEGSNYFNLQNIVPYSLKNMSTLFKNNIRRINNRVSKRESSFENLTKFRNNLSDYKLYSYASSQVGNWNFLYSIIIVIVLIILGLYIPEKTKKRV